MVVTAHGFAMPVKKAFAPLLKLRHWLNPVRLVPGWQSASAPALLRGIALVELAVLVVIVISREPENESVNCIATGAGAVCRRAAVVRNRSRRPRAAA